MRFLTSIILAVSTAVFVTAAPTTEVNLKSLNFPANEFTSMLEARNVDSLICPEHTDICGVVTFNDSQYTTFGEGTCIAIGSNVQSIYVSKCYCSIWNSCTGDSGKDVYVGGMMMCEKPRTLDSFDKEPKYISCGGKN